MSDQKGGKVTLDPENPRLGRVEAIDRLVSQMRGLKALEDEWPEHKHDCRDLAEHRRSICLQSLRVFDSFLQEIGNADARLEASLHLAQALNDAEDGINTEILTPRTLGHRPKFSSLVMNYRGRAAGVQDFLMAEPDRMATEAAATFILRTLGDEAVDRLRAQKDRTQLSWRTVNRWRNAPSGDDQLDLWKAVREMTKSLLSEMAAEPSKERSAKAVLMSLRDQICADLPRFE